MSDQSYQDFQVNPEADTAEVASDASSTEASTSVRLRVATPFVDSVQVGDVVVTTSGTDVPADQAEEIRAGAASAGVNLVEEIKS